MSAILRSGSLGDRRARARSVIEPAPEYGEHAVRIDGVVYLRREREFQSESLFMQWLRGGKTAWRSPESLNAEFAARKVAAAREGEVLHADS